MHLLIFFLGMAIYTLWYPPLEALATESLAVPEHSPTAFGDQEITMTSSGIHVQVKERPLQEILQSIQHRSGIQFSLSPALQAVTVTARIDAPDWPTAIQQLLRQFNTAEVW